ncbi:TIGR03619 family F420-dependent LLM class oxidoreductase [Actinomadura sp. SCN-SB]|uniref:TIGR03619 family F420-dependent LLM class oxidoreductase n=1 Tax=Actinomadura sp. SCN-SB TaxID=3373092 RepID=UPI003751299D
MKIALSLYDLEPRDLLDLATAADEFGFGGLWLGEHLVLPVEYGSAHPTHGQSGHQHHTGAIIDPATELMDPLVALGGAAAYTSRLTLATGIYLLPLRHPLLTARAVATLHELSGGRFKLGVGAGWLREEFDALAVPFKERFALLEETLDVLRAAWRGGPFEHQGTHFDIGRVQVSPRPVPVPLVLGGNSDKALRRAVRLGDEWFSSGTPSFEDALVLRDKLDRLCAEEGRVTGLRCHFRVARWDPELIRRYEAEGFTDVVLWADQVWGKGTLDENRRALAQAAERVGL